MHDFRGLRNLTLGLGRLEPDPAGLALRVQQGVNRPLDFPEFSEFLFSGDRVVIAIHAGIWGVELVLDPLLDELFDSGGQQGNQVTLLFADRESSERFAAAGKKRDRPVHSVIQEGTPDGALALLGADEDENPVLVHRLIFDADVLIPVVRAQDSPHDPAEAILWNFVDSQTKKRWRKQVLAGESKYGERVCDLAGASVIMEVLVGPGDFPYDVQIGIRVATEKSVITRMDAAWQLKTAAGADLVIASIDDRRDQRSWQAIRDAVVAAASVDGLAPIAIFSDVDEPPANELKTIFSTRPGKGSTMSHFDPELHKAIAGRTVLLSSRLPAELVRDLGLVPISLDGSNHAWAVRWQKPILLRDVQRWRHHHRSANDEAGRPMPVERRRATKSKPRSSRRTK